MAAGDGWDGHNGRANATTNLFAALPACESGKSSS